MPQSSPPLPPHLVPDYAPAPPRFTARRLRAVLVALGSAALLLAVALIVLPLLNHPSDMEPGAACRSNLRQIGSALLLYNYENRGAYPPDFQTLLKAEDLSGEIFVCPVSSEKPARGPTTNAVAAQLRGHVSYVYCASGLAAPVAPGTILAYEAMPNHGGSRVFLFADAYDGTAELVGPQRSHKLLSELSSGHNPPRPEKLK